MRAPLEHEVEYRAVVRNGRKVVDEGRLATVDYAVLQEKSHRAAERLANS